MPDDDERITLGEVPSIADVRYLHEARERQEEAKADGLESWQPRNLSEIEDRPPVQPELGGLGIVYPGKRHVFSGPQESAKTLAAYVVGLHVVRDGGRVVLIDFEMGPWDAKARLRELGTTDDELAAFLYVEPETPVSPEAVARLLALEPQLVIVDAAAGAFELEQLDDNSRKDVERWAQAWIRPFWKAGVATIVLDHVTKNAEQRGNYAIGSERKVGQADVHLGFSVVRPISRGDHGLYKVTTHKDRGGCLKRGHLCDFKLTSDPDTHAIAWEIVSPQVVDGEHPFRPTHLMESASRFIEACPIDDPPSENRILDAISGKSTDHKRLALERLVIEGFVERWIGARKAKLHRSLRNFREAEDDFASTSPDLAEISPETTSPLRLPPYRGGEVGEVSDGEAKSTSPDDDDGIPF